MSKNFIRIFIAISIPDPIKTDLASVSKISQHPCIRWISKENLHITLHFIGETPLDEIPLIKEKISAIASKTPSFTLTLEKLKVIKKNRKPVMIWVTLVENELFIKLALQLETSIPGYSKKKPTPHITMARIKKVKKLPIPVLPELRRRYVEVASIELMESIQGNFAASYVTMESFRLKVD